MQKTFEAIYEDGVLRPLEALTFTDREQVRLSVAAQPGDASVYFTAEEWERAKTDTVTLAEVRQALSSIPGSLADDVVVLREESY